MKAVKRVIGVILAVIIAFVGGVVVGQFVDISLFGNVFNKDEATIDVVTLQEQIAQVSELATLQDTITDEYYFDQDGIKIKNFKIPFTSKKLVVICDTIVKLGTDLESAKIDLSEDSKTATVTLAHSSILSSEIDEDSWQVMDQQDGLFNRVTIEDDDALRKTVKKQVKEKVNENGLLEQADTNVADQIKVLLETANPGLTVNVIFE